MLKISATRTLLLYPGFILYSTVKRVATIQCIFGRHLIGLASWAVKLQTLSVVIVWVCLLNINIQVFDFLSRSWPDRVLDLDLNHYNKKKSGWGQCHLHKRNPPTSQYVDNQKWRYTGIDIVACQACPALVKIARCLYRFYFNSLLARIHVLGQ